MLAFSNDYYGMIFRATQSVELFCAYVIKVNTIDRLEYLPIVFAFITIASFLPNRNTTSIWTSHLTFAHITHL